MRDVAGDPAALELLRVQRGRLADRMRPPWWYLPGVAILGALVFAFPFGSRFLPQGVRIWPILAAAVAVAWLLQWGLARATGIVVGTRTLDDPSGRPARIAMIVVSVAAYGTETFLIRRNLLAAAIVVAAVAVVAEVACCRAHLRGIREGLRAGGGAA
jgi:hypothetical protein